MWGWGQHGDSVGMGTERGWGWYRGQDGDSREVETAWVGDSEGMGTEWGSGDSMRMGTAVTPGGVGTVTGMDSKGGQ